MSYTSNSITAKQCFTCSNNYQRRGSILGAIELACRYRIPDPKVEDESSCLNYNNPTPENKYQYKERMDLLKKVITKEDVEGFKKLYDWSYCDLLNSIAGMQAELERKGASFPNKKLKVEYTDEMLMFYKKHFDGDYCE